jgi:hypothetical protein
MRRVFLHFACAFLLLSAQFTALSHSVWHLHDQLPAHGQHHQDAADDGGDGKTTSPQAKLCVLHAALGSLFAGGCGTQLTFAPADPADRPATSVADRQLARSAPTPPSRAPPVLL